MKLKNIQKQMKSHFEVNESYLHNNAIRVLNDWIKNDYLRTKIEDKFCMEGRIWFVADLACYNGNGLISIFEVVHTNEVNVFKQYRMWVYFKIHNWNVNVYRIEAEWIMKQTKEPNHLNTTKLL
jgi:hypothetical protein